MLENLNTFANLVQLASYEELLKQATNDDLFEELQHQNTVYLERILINQETIIKQLEEIYEINKRNFNRNIQHSYGTVNTKLPSDVGMSEARL